MKREVNSTYYNKLLLREICDNLYKQCGIDQQDKLVLGVSGGPDSTAMLHLLAHIHPTSLLDVVYVDHQLRPEETEQERDLLQRQCAALGTPFTALTVDVPAAVEETGESVEEAARRLRYEQLRKRLEKIDAAAVCVAHTADDQIEEFFVRLIRGTGTTGLSGMKPVTGNIIRPLLTVHKSQLLDSLRSMQISHSIDSSNKDLRYLRNRVRHSLLPFLQKNFHHSIGDTILRTTAILKDEDDFIEQQTTPIIQDGVYRQNGHIIINALLLAHHHIALKRRVLEKAVWMAGGKPSFATVNNLCKLAEAGERGRELHLEGGLLAVKEADGIHLLPPNDRTAGRPSAGKNRSFSLTIEHPGTHSVPVLNAQLTLTYQSKLPADDACLVLNGDKIQFPLTLRPVLPGERFHPFGRQGTKKINRFLSEKKIEKVKRQDFPLLLAQGTLLCIVGLEIDNNFKYDRTTASYLVVRWQRL